MVVTWFFYADLCCWFIGQRENRKSKSRVPGYIYKEVFLLQTLNSLVLLYFLGLPSLSIYFFLFPFPFQAIINDPFMLNSAILVFANKQDLVCSISSFHFHSLAHAWCTKMHVLNLFLRYMQYRVLTWFAFQSASKHFLLMKLGLHTRYIDQDVLYMREHVQFVWITHCEGCLILCDMFNQLIPPPCLYVDGAAQVVYVLCT